MSANNHKIRQLPPREDWERIVIALCNSYNIKKAEWGLMTWQRGFNLSFYNDIEMLEDLLNGKEV